MDTTDATEPTEGTVASASESAGATATTEGAGAQSATNVVFPVTPGPDWPDDLVFTLTPSQEAGGLIDTAQPLADALSERLGVEVTPQLPSDYAGVIIALDSGRAQIAGGLGPVQMVQAEDEAGADLILQSERFGVVRVRHAVVHQRPRHLLRRRAGRRPGDRVPVLQRRDGRRSRIRRSDR